MIKLLPTIMVALDWCITRYKSSIKYMNVHSLYTNKFFNQDWYNKHGIIAHTDSSIVHVKGVNGEHSVIEKKHADRTEKLLTGA